MATSKPTITTINDTFTTLVTNTNTVSLDLGATGRLNTNEDSSAVAAINELELGIRGTSNNLVATDLADFTANNIVSALNELDSDLHGSGGGNAKADLTTNAKDVVSAINEIEAVFDASTHEISAGTNDFSVITGAYDHNASGAVDISSTASITLDADSDIILDANGGDVLLKDNGVTYGSLTNTSGNLIIKSGTSTVMTGNGTNTTFNNNVDIDNDLTVDRDAQVTRNLNVDGITTVDSATVDGDLLVTDSAYIMSNLEVGGNVKIGNDKVNITASTGNTQIDGTLEVDGTLGADGNFRVGSSGQNKFTVTASNGNTNVAGTLGVTGAATLSSTLAVTGQTDLNGHVNLGDTNADNISIVGRVDTTIVPDADDTYDLGTSTLQWRDGYFDGTVYVDNLDADSAELGTLNFALNNITDSSVNIYGQTGAVTIDAETDINLDANGGDVFLKDNGTQYGALTNTSGNLIVKSGTTTALTFNGANVTTAGTVATGGNITVGGSTISRTGALTFDVSTNISLDADGGIVYLKDNNLQYGSLRNSERRLHIYSAGTKAIEFDSSANTNIQQNLDVAGLTTLDSSTIDGDLDLNGSVDVSTNATVHGNLDVDGLTTLDVVTIDNALTVTDSAYVTGNLDVGGGLDVDGTAGVDGNFRVGVDKFNVTASNGNTTIDGVLALANQDSDGINGNLETSNVAISLFRLDSAIGNLANFNDSDVSDHTSIVNAINAVAADVTQLSGSSTALDSRLGSLSNLDSDFVGAERDSIVNALNALRADIPLIFDENGTQLN